MCVFTGLMSLLIETKQESSVRHVIQLSSEYMPPGKDFKSKECPKSYTNTCGRMCFILFLMS